MIGEFIKPFLLEHSRTLIPGQPRDVMDIYIEKMIANKDMMRALASTKVRFPSCFHLRFTGFNVTLATVRNIEDTFRDLLTAGMETTSSQLEWIVHYMAKCPSVQAKLIAEIDTRLPNGILPSLHDLSKLPYTEAVIHEALRISSTVPFGNLHRALEDTEIAGYQVPKDTLVIGNLYAVNNDPNVWQNPREFRPERFITDDGTFTSGDNPVIGFGTRQRSCIGEELARKQLFLFTVQIFQRFRVRAAGELCSDHLFSAIVAPKPFQAIFERRD